MFLGRMLLAGAILSIHVVINRAARHLRGDTPLYRTTVAASSGATIHETRSLDELESTAQLIAQSDGKIAILCGGDGSYMAGVTAITHAFAGRTPPEIAFAPGGTVSTVARNWGMRGPLEKYARRILRSVIEGRATTTMRPTLRVRDDGGDDRVGFIFGAGLVAQFFEEYNASSEQGTFGAAKIVARIFGGSFVGSAFAKKILTPAPCSITVDGELAHARAFSLIASSVVRDLGLHMHLIHRAGVDPHRVHLVASPLGPLQLGPQMPLVLAGRRLLGRDHVDTLVENFRVTFDRKNGYVLDGDMLHATWVEVSAGPELRMLGLGDE